jgi:hypothetical protein
MQRIHTPGQELRDAADIFGTVVVAGPAEIQVKRLDLPQQQGRTCGQVLQPNSEMRKLWTTCCFGWVTQRHHEVFSLWENLSQLGSVERDTTVDLHSCHGAVHSFSHSAAGAAQAVRGIDGALRKLNNALENVWVAGRDSLETLPKPDGIMGPVHPSGANLLAFGTFDDIADELGQTPGTGNGVWQDDVSPKICRLALSVRTACKPTTLKRWRRDLKTVAALEHT